MKEIVNEVDVRKKGLDDPIVVHCSAGIGRTGTFVAIHMCLQRFKIERNYDVKETVTNLRKQRIGMVQSLEQYTFIHEVVSEIIDEIDDYQLLSNFSVNYEITKSPKKKRKQKKLKTSKGKSKTLIK